jgi:hypothetical protein
MGVNSGLVDAEEQAEVTMDAQAAKEGGWRRSWGWWRGERGGGGGGASRRQRLQSFCLGCCC